MKLTEVAEVERAKNGKVYPKGCTLIALSATKGQVEYLDNARDVETRWAVIVPKQEYVPRYIYYAITQAFPEFFHKRKTGINFQTDALLELKIVMLPKAEQEKYVKMLEMVDRKIQKEKEMIELLKHQKKVFSEKMFPTSAEGKRTD